MENPLIRASKKLKEAGNIYHSWTKSMEKTVKHFCTTANRIKNDAVEFLKNVDWKKVAITGAAIGLSTLAAFVTGGLAAPAIGAALGSGLGAAVVTGAVTGVIGGAVYGTTYSGLSGNDAKTVLKDTLVGAGTGALTGGAMGAVGYGIQSFLSRGTAAVSTAGTSAKNTVSGIADKADDAVTKLDDLGTAGCFIAGTSILTVTGTKNIEDIHVGDKVYAQNVNTDEQAGKEVRQIFRHEVDTLVYLEIEGEEIVTTPNHPFYVKDKGWVEAGHLTEEDKLVNRDHQLLEIKNLRVEEQEEPVTVYNFEVEDYHTYYVGDRHVLVHNSCQAHAPKGAGGADTVKNPYSHLENPPNVGIGKDFTAKQKSQIIRENMNQNKGVVKSDLSGQELVKPQKSMKGVTPPQNEWQIDHVVPKDKGGTNSYSNAQVLSRQENRAKWNK